MDSPVSLLKLTSAMARHAGHVHDVTARNIARADMPNATAERLEPFEASLRRLEHARPPRRSDTGMAINLEAQMLTMAEASSTHDAALTVWKSTLKMMRLAVGGNGS